MRFCACTDNVLKSSCLEKYDNSDFEAIDMCNDGNVKEELDNCFTDKCRDFERFGAPIILKYKWDRTNKL